MIVAVCFVVALSASALLWLAIGNGLSNERFTRTNFRGVELSGIGGVPLVCVTAVGSLALLILAEPDQLGPEWSFGGFQLAIGFGVLGLVDDLGGQQGGGGFRGHLHALRNRTVTTGLVKLVGGLVLSLFVAALVSRGDVVGLVRDAALLAGAANLANLFDRAPGRTLKVTSLTWIVMVVFAGTSATMAFGALAVGGAAGLSFFELREKLMLGDTGVNVLGAMVALSAVVHFGAMVLWIGLGCVVLLNLLSEVVSFSVVISRVRPLRWFDLLGRHAP